jgi:3-methyladenine DNA glycosylase AlkD
MAQYMRNQFKFYGLPAPMRKSVYKDFLKSEKLKKIIDWEFLDKCYQSDYREFQYIVMDYLANMQKYLKYEDIPKIKNYAKTKQWWDTIDGLDRIIGNIGLVDGRVDDLMIEWSEDKDFWIRRIAIDHQLLRKEKTNTDLLSKIICNNFGSEEFFINKAIGWSLREYSKCNPKWVKDFVEKYKDNMAKLSIKEATKYV